MLQRDFYLNVMESNLTEETIQYAKERFKKMVEKDRAKVEEREGIRRKILDVLADDEYGKFTAKAIAEYLDVSVQKASYHLYTLANEGLIEKFDGSPKEYATLEGKEVEEE